MAMGWRCSSTSALHQAQLPLLLLLLVLSAVSLFTSRPCSARPVSFSQDFRVTWAGSHVQQLDNGTTVQLRLDQSSGSGFASKSKFMFGKVSMHIKLIPGDSAGTVTAFYLNSETEEVRDEVDFEFLGNRTGQPYTVQTNVYARGKGDREQRVNLWFDPAASYHTYTILWNRHHIVFSVDDFPIRVYKNNEARGVPYPSSQPMGIFSTLWNADDWATRGGLDKTDWTKSPFFAYYRDFDVDACTAVPGGSGSCTARATNWWDSPSYRRLDPLQARKYRWVRLQHMIYDYCTDKSRYPVPPPECFLGI